MPAGGTPPPQTRLQCPVAGADQRAQLRCAHEDQLCLGAQGPYVAAGYHDDDYHYTLPCVGGPTDRQAAAQPCLRLTVKHLP